MIVKLLYPTVVCQYCQDRALCDACHGTKQIVNGLDNSAYGFSSVEYPKALSWNVVHEADFGDACQMTDMEIGSYLFELFNIGDRPVAIRSMSVGDRFSVDGRVYVTMPFGFDEVDTSSTKSEKA